MAELLAVYDAEFPGFLDYFQRLLTEYFAVGPLTHPLVAARMERCLGNLGPDLSRRHLSRLTEAGVFEPGPRRDDLQVRAIWTSPLMGLCRAAIGGAPGLEDDLVGSYPVPATGMAEHSLRQSAFRDTQLASVEDGVEKLYWRESLQLAAPELYLWPFLPGSGELRGLDLGCGWGRGALGMRDYSRLRMTGVDIGEEDLELLRAQALRAGLSERVEAVRADVTALPFVEGCFDFALSYLVLDLLSREALTRALGEVLRCLKPNSAFYVDMPTDYFCGSMQLQKQTARGFIELMHDQRARGKLFQLAFYDLRVPRQYTFAVLEEDSLDFPPRGGLRPAWLKKGAAAILQGRPPRGLQIVPTCATESLESGGRGRNPEALRGGLLGRVEIGEGTLGAYRLVGPGQKDVLHALDVTSHGPATGGQEILQRGKQVHVIEPRQPLPSSLKEKAYGRLAARSVRRFQERFGGEVGTVHGQQGQPGRTALAQAAQQARQRTLPGESLRVTHGSRALDGNGGWPGATQEQKLGEVGSHSPALQL